MISIALILILMTVFGFLCRAIAIKRNLDKVFWFVMGLGFGPLALPFVMFARNREA